MTRLLALLFGCPHHNLSWPFTPVSDHGIKGQCYRKCNECGATFPWDAERWEFAPAERPEALEARTA